MKSTAPNPDTMPLGLVTLRLKEYCRDYTGKLLPALNALARVDEDGVRDLLWEALEWERQDNSPQRMHSLAYMLRQCLRHYAIRSNAGGTNKNTTAMARAIDPNDFS